MSLRRLADVCRTTSFRLATLFLALFSLASLALFGFLFFEVKSFMRDKIDEWVLREEQEIVRLAPAEVKDRLQARIVGGANPERPMALFDRDGARVAGSAITPLAPLAANPAPFEFRLGGVPHETHFRGVVRQLPSGDMLVVAQGIGELREFNEVLVNAMILAGAVTALLGLAGAVLTGAAAVRQIDAITGATRDIITGDLSRRLPTDGTSGDVARLARVVNEMLAEIERLMREVKGVCDNIAHDLRTPLTRLLAGLERAQRRAATPADYAEGIDEAIGETRGILKTFGALLRISEVEDGVRRSGFTRVDLAEVTSDVVEFYEPFSEEKGVALQLAADSEPLPDFSGDRNLLFEAFGNLIDNAIKFTPAGGSVRVRSFREGDRVGVTVSDTGPGIPSEEQDAVLRRFYRAEKSRHRPGNGLGLSLVAAVARLHGMDVVFGGEAAGCSITLQYRPART
ncbi:sensor histidine kinase [Labrys wisconsinensis]|uniref:histidine kinase n=1 Tax=Labrys wisconsinensis TaxID=425677 RepID=A0ABU0J8F6_9HYPH|nr:ATP-binding protein [Labrys wisconsinensis]MDQ0470539.1 signal transduction histidine kinase [Labrys wisconsinensis]